MREIEFRGKRIDNNEWIYGWLRQSGHQDIEKSNGQYIRTEKYYQIQDDKYNSQFIDEETIGQYTGIKDKNGKKIFEGDILLRKTGQFESICLVKWGKVEFSFLYKNRYDGKIRKGKWTRGTYQGLDSYGEVIGNIYDNPELLKEEI